MNELEQRAFEVAARFYAKWRENIIETDEQWMAFAEDFRETFAPVSSCPIGLHLSTAVFIAFSDLYRNGKKPMPANYFGRDDL
jgi:hypothetical protein